jgi:hypothetical protein
LENGNNVLSSSRDKVEIHRNGSWKFLSDNRLKYQKKRPIHHPNNLKAREQKLKAVVVKQR